MHANNIHIVCFGIMNPYFLHISALPFVDTFLNMKCIVSFLHLLDPDLPFYVPR